jgi:hypothetical protein
MADTPKKSGSTVNKPTPGNKVSRTSTDHKSSRNVKTGTGRSQQKTVSTKPRPGSGSDGS